jgi:hypothetical protein
MIKLYSAVAHAIVFVIAQLGLVWFSYGMFEDDPFAYRIVICCVVMTGFVLMGAFNLGQHYKDR